MPSLLDLLAALGSPPEPTSARDRLKRLKESEAQQAADRRGNRVEDAATPESESQRRDADDTAGGEGDPD